MKTKQLKVLRKMNKVKLIFYGLILFLPGLGNTQTLSDRLRDLDSFLNNSTTQQFLHPDEAFVLSVSQVNHDLLRINVVIADGYYLYHDKFNFQFIEGSNRVYNDAVVIPPGKIKEDESFGKVEVNVGVFDINVPLLRGDTTDTVTTFQYGYQGCKDNALCYPPIKKSLQLVLSEATNQNEIMGQVNSKNAVEPRPPMISMQDSFTGKLISGGIFLNIFAFFVAGLLLSMTPCVFPMIPILSGIIVEQGKTITPSEGFVLSFIYVTAMALTYAVIGIFTAQLGVNVQAGAQNIWVISIFCLVFIALAFSMFGFYEIQLPASVQSKLTRISNSQKGGTLSGVAIMGAVSAVIVGPCVAPPLVGALAYIAQTGDKILGGMALFFMGIGMGVPLLVIGSSAGTLMPKVGSWMETIKKVFGVGLLALAIWFLARVVTPAVELFLWGLLLSISAIYMGAFDKLEKGDSWPRLWKGVGLVMLTYGLLLIVGASTGATNIFKPLQAVISSGNEVEGAEETLPFKRVKSVEDFDMALQQASINGKVAMLDFYADWCIECIRMEANTFTDPEVQKVLENIVLLQADVTKNDKQDKELLKHFSIYGPPAILFFDQNKKEKVPYRLYGFFAPDVFIEHIRRVTYTSI